MAHQPPDPRTLTNWEDAFQHPLPAVRHLEHQLRTTISSNREKLRSLVGASYRDLLGTAERIVEMDQQMQVVENTLGGIGRKCNARALERTGENRARMRGSLVGEREERLGVVGMTRVLQNAVTMVVRVVRGKGDVLVAAKLLVLGRLLYRQVAGSRQKPAVVEELRGRLGTTRKRLLGYLERVVAGTEGDKMVLARSLCGYALITSSTPKEVLRYFLQTRYQRLESKLETPTTESMLQMLELYSQTLLDCRDLFPRRFADGLEQLAKVPLVQDEQVRSVAELNLDVYGTFIAPDIRTFTPWVRHEQVTAAEVGDALTSWTSQAQECVLEGLREYLKAQPDARVVFDTRQKIISKYLSLGGKLRGQSHSEAIESIRAAFLERLQQLASDAGGLRGLTLNAADVSSQNDDVERAGSLWGLATEDFDLSHGAAKFRSAVLNTRHGRGPLLQAETRKLDDWVARIHSVLDLVEEMRTSRWDTDIDFDLEDLDDHDALLRQLNKGDVEAVIAHLREACVGSVEQTTQEITSSGAETKHATYYIRLWREIDRRQRALQQRLDLPLTRLSLTELYRNIAKSFGTEPLENYAEAAKKHSHVAVTLFDGTPALPLQPSPATFRFLVALQKALAAVGSDVWSGQAVGELKAVLAEELGGRLADDVFTKPMKTGLTNGHAENHDDNDGDDENTADGEDEQKITNGASACKDEGRDRLLQNFYDVQYLHRVLRRSQEDEENGLARLASSLRTTLELDDAATERMEKSANEYWKRTHLLFGLLAPGREGKKY
ncbi:uncharacterized protein LTR77_002877 [Saxophila tyrrhenica]|uniref:Conserved oligomeric Golgi complex subunit 1 n=1 Tax=Saxophila tyrrhenica TaxID=1690608 RepID=A0AAV9PIZ1_9PEZI|nr:hypothetical protein LTR77_002877 [Saxophila tyrrhenica]